MSAARAGASTQTSAVANIAAMPVRLRRDDDGERAMAVLRPRDIPMCHHSGRDPPRARAPHAGRMTGSGRSPGSRVIALLRLPGPAWRAQWQTGEGLAAD